MGKSKHSDTFYNHLEKILISEYSDIEDIPYKESERRIEVLIEVCRKIIIECGTLSLRRFGFFYLSNRKSCKYYNKYTGVTEEISMIKVLRCKPAKSLKDIINNRTKKEMLGVINSNK